MAEMHTVEILLATYNGDRFVGEQLDSILRQTYSNWTLTIRDDGSRDNTVAIIQTYAAKHAGKIRIINDGEQNLGSSKNFIRLMEQSAAAYVMLCDQDDIWLDDKIERSIEKLWEMEQVKGKTVPLMVFTDLTIINESGKVLHASFWRAQKLFPAITGTVYKTIAQSTVTGCTIILNRGAVEKVLPALVPQFQHDHWISICVAYYGQIAYLEKPTIFYRMHGANDVGLKQPTFTYLLERIKNGYNLFRSWMDIKRNTAIKFSIAAVLLFKISFNIKRLWLQLLKK